MHPPDPLRMCDQLGCVWVGAHAENCSNCFGWGWVVEGDRTYQVIGEILDCWHSHWRAVACATCAGTPLGRIDPYAYATEASPDAAPAA